MDELKAIYSQLDIDEIPAHSRKDWRIIEKYYPGKLAGSFVELLDLAYDVANDSCTEPESFEKLCSAYSSSKSYESLVYKTHRLLTSLSNPVFEDIERFDTLKILASCEPDCTEYVSYTTPEKNFVIRYIPPKLSQKYPNFYIALDTVKKIGGYFEYALQEFMKWDKNIKFHKHPIPVMLKMMLPDVNDPGLRAKMGGTKSKQNIRLNAYYCRSSAEVASYYAAHELFHHVQYHYNADILRQQKPFWFMEGMANWAATKVTQLCWTHQIRKYLVNTAALKYERTLTNAGYSAQLFWWYVDVNSKDINDSLVIKVLQELLKEYPYTARQPLPCDEYEKQGAVIAVKLALAKHKEGVKPDKFYHDFLCSLLDPSWCIHPKESKPMYHNLTGICGDSSYPLQVSDFVHLPPQTATTHKVSAYGAIFISLRIQSGVLAELTIKDKKLGNWSGPHLENVHISHAFKRNGKLEIVKCLETGNTGHNGAKLQLDIDQRQDHVVIISSTPTLKIRARELTFFLEIK